MKSNQSTIQIRCPVCRKTDYYPIGAQDLTCSCCGADLSNPQRPAKRTFPDAPPIRKPRIPQAMPEDQHREIHTHRNADRDDWYKRGGLLQKTLATVKDAHAWVTIYTINGVQMHGFVTGFDTECVVLDSDGNTPVIMRSAISTILPGNVLKTAAAKQE